jgi:SP family myo-inositol transporter-like MFS transporter 13
MKQTGERNIALYGAMVTLVAGLGGLLYGIDIGIITTALLYLGATISLTTLQTSVIVAAVLAGGTASSLVGGLLADWLGRKRMMILSGLLFVVSVGLIVAAQGFTLLLVGRLLQGVSAGIIAVVVPLYLAECLSPETRGRGTSIFQFMLTLGLVAAALVGYHYAAYAKAAMEAAAGDATLIRAAQNHAWHGMFLAALYPGVMFFVGAIFLSESPRWLYRKGRREQAFAALRRASSEADAERQLHEMDAIAAEAPERSAGSTSGAGSLLRRKFVVPFVLACVILACNQGTGINSILSYLVLILREAGMSATRATQGNIAVTLLNCGMTLVAVALIERKGRKFLLSLGTAGIIVALFTAGLLFYRVESTRQDVAARMQAAVHANTLSLPVNAVGPADGNVRLVSLSYTYGQGSKMVSVRTDDPHPFVEIEPAAGETGPLRILRASFGDIPSEKTGWLITACLALFIASFAAGPGVVVWLALSELMPTRIRSAGMGIALLLNQGVSTLIAGVFLPVVGRFGYYAMFWLWTASTVIYFLVAAFALPETRGKTLEEIERSFERAETASSI